MDTTDLLPPEILEEDPLLDSAAQWEEAARALDLEDSIAQRIKHPEREILVNLCIQRDSEVAPPLSRQRRGVPCEALACTGIRVQHFRARAGCLGPVLLAPDAHLSELRPLALHMSLQCALFDLPLGGSAGAIVCDPAQLSERELRHLVRDYLAALDLRDDIFAPSEFLAAWTKTGRHIKTVAVVGKPAVLGGIPDPASATAAGWFTLISEALSRQEASLRSSPLPATSGQLSNCRVALQGFGPAAAALAAQLRDAGARIIALADKSGGIFDERGLDMAALSAHVKREGILYGFSGAEPVRNSDVLESPCDVLVTAAAERQLNAQNTSRIRARFVLEAFRKAVTPAATRRLTSAGVTVIPDLLGAAPPTLAWFAEWQHALHCSLPEQENIEREIRRKLSGAFRRVHAAAVAQQSSLPDACRYLAMENLASVLRLVV